MMTGRKSKNSREVLCNLLEANKENIVKNGKVSVPSDPIWNNLIFQYNLKGTSKALYSSSLRYFNTQKILSNTIIGEPLQSSSESLETGYDDETDEEELSNLPNTRYFKIVLNADQLKECNPKEYIFQNKLKNGEIKSRSNYGLSGNWTSIIATEVSICSKLPCVWSFKKNFVAKSSDALHGLDLRAKCVCCSSTLKVYSDNITLDFTSLENIILNCEAQNVKFDILHDKKRFLQGSERTNLANMMVEQNLTASLVRKTLAEKSTFFHKELPYLPKLETLRKIKSECINKTRYSSDPVQCLLRASQINPLNSVIKEIGVFKFFVHYWTSFQTRLYNHYNKKKGLAISIDATGGVVRKLQRLQEQSGHILLYMIVTKLTNNSESQVPLCQMLSERHNTNAITYWLSEWKRAGATNPSEVVCDHSVAILSAAARSFTDCGNTTKYNEDCFRVLTTNDTLMLPATFIRIDVAHLIKAVSGWKEFSNVRRRIKQFYIKCIGQLVLSVHFEEFTENLKNIFIVALSEFEGFNNSQETPCEIAKKALLSKLSFGMEHSEVYNVFELDVDLQDNNEQITEGDTINEIQEDNGSKNIVEFIKDLIVSCQKEAEVEGDRDNIMYFPKIVNSIKKLCYSFPMWSAVMVKYFKRGKITASSTAVESHFNDIKTRLIKNLPQRIDDFVHHHAKILEGTMKLASGLCTEPIEPKEKPNCTTKIDIDSRDRNHHDQDPNFRTCYLSQNDELQAEENWRGINTRKIKRRKTSSDIKPIYDWSLIDKQASSEESTLQQNRDIPNYQIKKSSNDIVTPSDTCGLDNATIDTTSAMCESYPLKSKSKHPRQSKKQKISFYLNPTSEWSSMDLNDTLSKPIVLTVLQNGGTMKTYQTRRISGDIVTLSNTCGFDSLATVIGSALCDSKHLKTLINDEVQNRTFDFALLLSEKNVSEKAYEERYRLLTGIFPKTEVAKSEVKRIDCQTTIANLVKKLQLVSYSKMAICLKCCKERTEEVYAVSINPEILKDGICNLQDAFENDRKTFVTCCNTNWNSKDKFSNIVFIELFLYPTDGSEYERHVQCLLDDIPKSLRLTSTIVYYLRGVIEFIPPLDPSYPGHFVAYCLRSNSTWEVYDDTKKNKERRPNTFAVNVCAVVYSV